ncbi:hypothetical protein SUT007_14980 [Streptococcus parasuis]|nr:hypothetical protein SUT007_14980 [Streptococcus parasuis]
MKLLSYSHQRLIMLNFFDNSRYLSIDNVVDSKETVQSSLPTTSEKETNFISFIGLTVLATSFAFVARQ